MEKHKAELATKVPQPISITLPDGKVISGESWRTTPLNVAEQIRYERLKSGSFIIKSFDVSLSFKQRFS